MAEPLGPNFRELVGRKIALDAVPPGGGFSSVLKFLQEPGRVSESLREAVEWAAAAIAVVRTAAEPNPWREASDEQIAGEILRLAEEREKEQKKEREKEQKEKCKP